MLDTRDVRDTQGRNKVPEAREGVRHEDEADSRRDHQHVLGPKGSRDCYLGCSARAYTTRQGRGCPSSSNQPNTLWLRLEPHNRGSAWNPSSVAPLGTPQPWLRLEARKRGSA